MNSYNFNYFYVYHRTSLIKKYTRKRSARPLEKYTTMPDPDIGVINLIQKYTDSLIKGRLQKKTVEKIE